MNDDRHRDDPFPEQTRILGRFHHHQQKHADEQKLGQILRETGEPAPTVTSRTITTADHTDKARLRGIPVAGGATGTSPGTDPLIAALHSVR